MIKLAFDALIKILIFTMEQTHYVLMSIIDRILALLKGSNGSVNSNGATTMSTNTTPANNNPYTIHVSIRIDAMALSNDYKSLFLIDAGKLITFPLDTPSGLIIGTLSNKLTFAYQKNNTSVGALKDDGTPESQFIIRATQSYGTNNLDTENLTETRFELPLEETPAYAPFYFPSEKVIAIMGMGDIGGFFEEVPDKEDVIDVLPIPTKDNVIKIFRRDGDILITSQRGRFRNIQAQEEEEVI